MTDVLSAQQIEEFVELGFCTLRRAFTAQQAGAACDLVWARMAQRAAIHRDDPRTWPALYVLEEHLDAPAVRACFSDRLAEAIEMLLGPGRWKGFRDWGFWPVNFSFGAGETDPFPNWNWHVDGKWFTHTLDAPNQGLLVVGLFTDLAPGGGGTALALGSHAATARTLARHPRGLTRGELLAEVLREPIGNFHQITGEAGDVVLAHPFLFHSRAHKRSGPPRIVSIGGAPLRAPMNFDRADGDYSVLEQSVRWALRSAPVAPSQAKLCRY